MSIKCLASGHKFQQINKTIREASQTHHEKLLRSIVFLMLAHHKLQWIYMDAAILIQISTGMEWQTDSYIFYTSLQWYPCHYVCATLIEITQKKIQNKQIFSSKYEHDYMLQKLTDFYSMVLLSILTHIFPYFNFVSAVYVP